MLLPSPTAEATGKKLLGFSASRSSRHRHRRLSVQTAAPSLSAAGEEGLAPPAAPPCCSGGSAFALGVYPPNAMNRNRKRRKRKRRGDERAAACVPSPSSASFDRDVFPVLLAAVRTTRQTGSSSSPPAALAARLLRRVLSRSPQTLSPLPRSLVALLPLLLSSRWVRVRTSQTPPPCALHPCPSEC